MRNRTAVVIIHGMGSQYPMDTIRSFAEAIQPEGTEFYSSPNRITNETETRRLSFSRRRHDFYEYYWAHHVDEPALGPIINWAIRLLFIRKPSAALQRDIWLIRAVIIFLLLAVVGVGILAYINREALLSHWVATSAIAVAFYSTMRLLWPWISGSMAGKIKSSIGDVIKYTIPSPENIAARDRVRKGGLELLRNLHEAKVDNEYRYAKIIVIGHSLGSIVAYDILSSLFAEYHAKYENVPPPPVKQPQLDTVLAASANPDHTNFAYHKLQRNLYREYNKLGNRWRVSNFITLGSPLAHAGMLMADSDTIFEKKKQQREMPTSPPQFDSGSSGFTYSSKYTDVNGKPVNINILHHGAYLAQTQWLNMYYRNDWVGGPVAPQFGAGVYDVQLKPTGKLADKIPLATHTKYWDRDYPEALALLKDVLIL